MSFGLNDLQSVLADWPSINDLPSKPNDSLMDRICQVLRVAEKERNVKGWQSDLQPLLRHALLRENKAAKSTIRLRVPIGWGWPDLQNWNKHGFEVLQAGESAYLLNALDWHPEWLGSGNGGVFTDAFSNEVIRRQKSCPADPFIRDTTGFENYSSPGQREGIRAAFLIPEGETLIVNLPTGSGKSLVGQAPALVHKEDGHLTLFVVPTVALALDQARAMRELFRRQDPSRDDWPLAWYGGLQREQRLEVLKRLRNGTQRILFTSPEALTTSLLRAAIECAESGMLRYFVIDEAHLITQWGDEFRPTFQALAGLRQSMLKRAPRGFRTLLMSATFTQETVDTLASLFGPREQVQMVSAVHLRPEPQYWFYGAETPKEKQLRVLEALRHAPRPFILYVTKREEVTEWNSLLRNTGELRRIATFDGKTPDSERLRVIEQWAENRLDGVIATSAFGVGLDKNDVRTVIHATIPETLDRFYQEVGRGGRDGKHSVSLLVFEKSDWTLPERLAKPKIISEELGYGRWKAMFESYKPTDEPNLIEINIDAVRQGLPGSSEYNVNWNMRTLILMVRAGLISLELQENSSGPPEEPGEQASSLLAATANIRIKILNDGHLMPEIWETLIANSRNATLRAAERNLQMMRELLPGSTQGVTSVGREVGETLAQLYQIKSAQWPVHVSHACGGCPRDRFDAITPSYYCDPVTVPASRVISYSYQAWLEKFPWLNSGFTYVFYDEDRDGETVRQEIVQLTVWLIQSCGVREISNDPKSSIAQHSDWSGFYKRANDKVLLHRSPSESEMEPYSPLPRLTVLSANVTPALMLQIQMLQRPFHIVLLPLGIPDPENPQRQLSEVSSHSIRLEALIQEINQ